MISVKKLLMKKPWFTPVILANQEAEIRRTETRGQPRQIVQKTLISKIT
jgi:hypothetical protein